MLCPQAEKQPHSTALRAGFVETKHGYGCPQGFKSESAVAKGYGGQVFLRLRRKVETTNLHHYARMQYTAYEHRYMEIFCNGDF